MTDTLRSGDGREGLVATVKRRGGRGDRSALSAWFFDVDRMLLGLTLFLIAIGLVAVAAASPATAVRYSGEQHSLAPLHYFWRQLMWVGVSVPVLIAVSMLPVATARRLALIGAVVFGTLLALTPLIGAIAVDKMRQANLMVDRDTDKRSPADAARWLEASLK